MSASTDGGVAREQDETSRQWAARVAARYADEHKWFTSTSLLATICDRLYQSSDTSDAARADAMIAAWNR